MTPEIAPYHAAILAVCDEFDALALDLSSVRTSASRLADAATTAAAAMPVNTRATSTPTIAGQRIDVIAKTFNVAGSRFARNVTPPRKWIHLNKQRHAFNVGWGHDWM